MFVPFIYFVALLALLWSVPELFRLSLGFLASLISDPP